MNKFISRKFVVTLLTLIAMVLGPLTGVELDQAQIASLAGVVMVYLGGQSMVDRESEKKKGE